MLDLLPISLDREFKDFFCKCLYCSTGFDVGTTYLLFPTVVQDKVTPLIYVLLFAKHIPFRPCTLTE